MQNEHHFLTWPYSSLEPRHDIGGMPGERGYRGVRYSPRSPLRDRSDGTPAASALHRTAIAKMTSCVLAVRSAHSVRSFACSVGDQSYPIDSTGGAPYSCSRTSGMSAYNDADGCRWPMAPICEASLPPWHCARRCTSGSSPWSSSATIRNPLGSLLAKLIRSVCRQVVDRDGHLPQHVHTRLPPFMQENKGLTGMLDQAGFTLFRKVNTPPYRLGNRRYNIAQRDTLENAKIRSF